jgi:hypothetical protein
MKDIFARLQTVDFQAYGEALAEIRTKLDAGEKAEGIDDTDVFFCLRPFCWFLHNPGFQDTMDTAEDAMHVLQAHQQLLMEETNPLMGNEFLAVARFLASYLDKGTFDPTEWRMLFASPEIATSTTAKKYAEKLEAVDADATAKMKALAEVMSQIEGSKHLSYWILRHIGADNLGVLEQMIHSFPSGDQTYILHALDAFPQNQEVIEFYERFIEKTQYDNLKEEAEKYLETVK